MAKKSGIDKAIAQVNAEISVLLSVRDRLLQQRNEPKPKRPRAVKPEAVA